MRGKKLPAHEHPNTPASAQSSLIASYQPLGSIRIMPSDCFQIGFIISLQETLHVSQYWIWQIKQRHFCKIDQFFFLLAHCIICLLAHQTDLLLSRALQTFKTPPENKFLPGATIMYICSKLWSPWKAGLIQRHVAPPAKHRSDARFLPQA